MEGDFVIIFYYNFTIPNVKLTSLNKNKVNKFNYKGFFLTLLTKLWVLCLV